MDAVITGGGKIPQVGLGTYLQSDEEASASVEHALRAGYRHIDTAEFYANHRGIAQGIKKSCVPREQLFITDKVNPGGIFGQAGKTYQQVIQRLKDALQLLDTTYVDLFLIHHPGAKAERLDQWKALVTLKEQGLTKLAGVSNYSIKHLQEIETAGLPTPDANQIEIHPMCTQTELVAYCQAHNIAVIAYSSLAPSSTWRIAPGQNSAKSTAVSEGSAAKLDVLQNIAAKYAVTEAQLLLRWAVQHGYGILPKSSKPERILQNMQLFHFTIAEEDMATLDALDENLPMAWPAGNPLDWE